MRKFSDESEVYYRRSNVNIRKNFLKFILTDFDKFNKKDINEIINWLLSGKFGYDPYTEFYDEYLILKDDNWIESKINLLLDSLENTNSLKDACNDSNISFYKVNIWLELGKNGEIPFDILYNQYKLYLNSIIEQKINRFISTFNGFNEIEACDESNISQIQLASWLRLNKLGGIFKKLYDHYLKIASDNDYSEYFDFNGYEKISKNTLDFLFELSDIGKDKYLDFYKDYTSIFNIRYEKNIDYPESYIEQFLDSFHNHHKIGSLKLLNMQSVNTCDVLDLVDSKGSNQRFYKENNINDFLSYVSLGYDDFKAARLANISFDLIDDWLNNGIHELAYDTFFEDYNSALILNNYLDLINDKIDPFVRYLIQGKSLIETCELLSLSFRDIELYLNLGYLGYGPYTTLFAEFENTLKNKFYEENNLKKFLEIIEEGQFESSALNSSKIQIKKFYEIIEKGHKGETPYKLFISDYKLALIKNYEANKDSRIKDFIDYINKGNSDENASKLSGIPLKIIEFWISLNILKDFKIKYFKARDSKYFSPEYVDAREIFIKNIKSGLNKSDACENLPFSLKEVNVWLKNGKLNVGPYVEFYQDYQKVTNNYFSPYNSNSRELFLKSIEEGLSKAQAIRQNNLSADEINGFLNLGKDGNEPYNEFYNQYLKAKETFYFNESNVQIRKTFLNAIEEGYTIDLAIKRYNLPSSLIKKWLDDGFKLIKPYNGFYDEYYRVKHSYFNDSNKKMRNIFLNSVKKGFSQSESIKKNNLPEGKINNWLSLGFEGKEPYTEFYSEFKDSLYEGFYERYDIGLFLKEIESESLKQEALYKIQMTNEDFNDYYQKGKDQDETYKKFYLDYNDSLKKFFNSQPESKRNNFIDDFSKGKSLEESSDNAGLPKNYVNKCIELKDEAEFFKTFYNKLKKAYSNSYYIRVEDNKAEFYNLIEQGETIVNASEISGLKLKKVKSWISNGKKETSNYHDFFENYLKATIKFYCLDETKIKRKGIIEFISEGVDKREACEKSNLNIGHVDNWFSLANRKIEPFVEFKKEYGQAIISFFNSKENTKKLDMIINWIKKDKVLSEACGKVGLDVVLVRSWLTKGKNGKKPYVEFYNRYNEALINQLNKYDDKLDEFFNLIASGNTIDGACKSLKLNPKMVKNWISNGRAGNEIYAEFFERYDEIRKNK